jgi:hypothetical protein
MKSPNDLPWKLKSTLSKILALFTQNEGFYAEKICRTIAFKTK